MSSSADRESAERRAGSKCRVSGTPGKPDAPDTGRLLASFARQSNDAILVCAFAPANPSGRELFNIVFANPAAERLLGLDESALIGANLLAVLAAAGDEPARSVFRGVLQSRSSTPVKLSLQSEGESTRAYDLHAIPLATDRQPEEEYWVFVLRKRPTLGQREEAWRRREQELKAAISERESDLESSRATLQQSKRLAAIGTVAAGLAHDMGNLLLPIRGHLKALENADFGDVARMHLDAIAESADYLEQTTENLRLFALDPESTADVGGVTDLKEWLGHVLLLLGHAIPDKVRFVAEVPDDLPCVGVAAHRLTQAVLNLVLNAKEAVAGSGTIRLWGKPGADGRFICIGVTDDGCGMTSEVREHCFVPFFTTKTRGQSTGLGLSLVHGVAAAAGGSVEIDSRSGHGTTVAMRLPVAGPGAGVTERPKQNADAIARVSLSDHRVGACFTALLQSVGFTVREGQPTSQERVSLWVTDASRSALATAKRICASDSRCRIIVFGSCPEKWRSICTASIDKNGGLAAIREALDHMMAMASAENLNE